MTPIYTDPRCLEHFAPGHPERPDRMTAALRGLQSDADFYVWPETRPADEGDVAAVHSESHVRTVRQLAQQGGGWLDPDTFVVPASYDAALLAAGATLQATSDVMAGRYDSAFVVVRPPGHHATPNRGMGFCLFNSIAIAARWAVRHGAQRAAILDIDVHHGNGTQDILFDRPDVLYYSTHQYPFYPGTGRVEDVGAGDGTGATVNLPLPAGCGDDTFLMATDQVLTPALRRFRPDIVLVSLGFDAHWADPLASMRLTTHGYTQILLGIRRLAKELCGGRLVLLLEGGYDLRVLEVGARAAGAVLAGGNVAEDPIGPGPHAPEPARAQAVVSMAREIHGLAD
jgi:acetoin utilization deacetylase AcuC-like enzyme